MYLSYLIVYLASFGGCMRAQEQTFIQDDQSATSTIRDVLLANSIIPEILDDFEPLYYIDLAYPKHDDQVLLGNTIKVKHLSKRPTFTVHELEIPHIPTIQLDKVYTLILTDPDATSRDNPKWSEMCHWVVTNLTTPTPGTPPAFDAEKALAGELMEYMPPSPPPKTGPHRYVFVLLEGDTTNVKAPSERKHWGYGKVRHGVRDWAKENQLTVVGANFFYAKNKKQ